MMTTQHCSAGIVGRSGGLVGRCLRTTKLIERDGRLYCWQHDPVYLAAKAEAKGREREEAAAYHLAQFDTMQARHQAEQEAAALIVRLADWLKAEDFVLGLARAEVDNRTADEILALAARLRESPPEAGR